MTTEANTEIHKITWQGRKIEIRYQPRSFAGCAHLEIKAKAARPLPITQTGYRSPFTAREDIEQEGGVGRFHAGLFGFSGCLVLDIQTLFTFFWIFFAYRR